MNRLIYGFHSVTNYINNHSKCVENVYIDANRQDKRLREFTELTKKYGISLNKISGSELDNLAKTTTHQGIVAKVKPLPQPSLKEFLPSLINKKNAKILVLDGITDPQNLGAIIRTADCFGVDAIIIPKDNSANTNSGIVDKASSGAINNITIISVTNLTQAIDILKEYEFWIAGTSLDKTSINLFEFKFNGRLAWVMGNEASGIRRLVQESCDYLITIPMQGNTQSLNVSVATGVILAYTNFIQMSHIK